MKIGLFGARADDRGLGRLTHDFYRHVQPDRTVVVDMGPHARGFTQHLARYPDATTTPFAGGTIAEHVMRKFFAGLDVAVMYETAYDHRAYDIARAAGCRTVLMVMPEFHRHLTEHLPHPDVIWIPTSWRADTIPDARIVPAPVEPEAGPRPTRRPGPLRVVHVAGHRSAADRNGTLAFLRSLRSIRQPISVRVATQDARVPHVNGIPRTMPFTVDRSAGPDHWRLYDNADLLVMPRRYGGLCLPVQEALAAGLAVAMTGCAPNPQTWPVACFPYTDGGTLATPAGPVTIHNPDPAAVAATINELAADPDQVAALKASAGEWAAANTWSALLPLYRAELERAAAPVPAG